MPETQRFARLRPASLKKPSRVVRRVELVLRYHPGRLFPMGLKTTPHSFNFRMDEDQYEELARLAAEAELPVQQFIELRLFGRIRPRRDPHAPRKQREQLPLPLEEEAPIRKSA